MIDYSLKIIKQIYLFCLCLLFLSVVPTFRSAAQIKQASSDYLIVEKSDELLVYNKYQQRITQSEQKLFIPFIPLKIIEHNATLGDNFTLCSRIEVNGITYYLIKNDVNSYAGTTNAGLLNLIRKAEDLNDTIRVLSGKKIELMSPDLNHSIFLGNQVKLIRYFQNGNHVYVITLNKLAKYGWVNVDDEYEIWHETKQNDKPLFQSKEQIVKQITSKLEEVNKLLSDLFLIFNKETIKTKTPPQWRKIKSGSSVLFLFEPKYYQQYYQESNTQLKSDIQSILSSSKYTAKILPGSIEIKEK